MRNKLIGAVLLVIVLVQPVSSQEKFTDDQWPLITAENKPWTRWWWHGSAVSKDGITKELEKLQKAGIGGVEITPIYGTFGAENTFIRFLSEEWMDLLDHTFTEAKRLGLLVDMATGTGWPFGGPWINEVHACKNVTIDQYQINSAIDIPKRIVHLQDAYIRSVGMNIEGKQKSVTNVNDLKLPLSANNLQELAIDQLRISRNLPIVSLMAYPRQGEPLDLTSKVGPDGKLNWKYPGGQWKLFAVFMGDHGKMVERAGPGGEGNVIDHFSRKALQQYLQKFDSAFLQHDIGSLRAFFNDSYEVDDASGNADWTDNFLDEFLNRRGYDLTRYLPQLLLPDSSEMKARILCDYRETVSDLLLDNFTSPWNTWAEKHGAMVRNQAHGSPSNILDLYGTVDIPEVEGTEALRTRMASSAGNVTGKKLVSAEAATWLDEHFKSSLSEVKDNVDQFLLNGVNHVVYHGTAYSPENEDWPGWLFYAAVHFNSRNPFWKDFKTLNDYVARCQALLQNSSPDNDILLYYPIHDRFSTPTKELIDHFDGIGKQFAGTDFEKCANHLLRTGHSFDFISDKQVKNLAVEKGKLVTEGNRSYQVILIPAVTFIPMATLEKLKLLSEAGARIIFSQRLPTTFAGNDVKDTRTRFELVKSALHRRASNGSDLSVGPNIDEMLSRFHIRSESMVKHHITFLKRKFDRGVLYFLKNDTDQEFAGHVVVRDTASSFLIYNPMNGQVGLAHVTPTDSGSSVYLQLSPHETLFVRTLNGELPGLERYGFFQDIGSPSPIKGTWTVTFKDGGPGLPEPLKLDSLRSWTDFGDAYEAFSGTAHYETSFTLGKDRAAYYRLSLPGVGETASVYLNDANLGTLIGPQYSVMIKGDVVQDNNHLKIVVSNSMANRIAYLDRKNVQWKKFYNINFPARKPENASNGLFDASRWKPESSGLIGTPTLTPCREK